MNITLPNSTTNPLLTPQIANYVFNGHLYTPHHLTHPLLVLSRTAFPAIDTHLQSPSAPSSSTSSTDDNNNPPQTSYLTSPTLPEDLDHLIRNYTTTLTTPGPHGAGLRSRPRWFYANCAVFGTLLGRAFALLSTPTRPPVSLTNVSDFPFSKLPAELRLQIYEYYKENRAQRQRYWDVISRIFVKALWAGREPEEGASYIAGIILLTGGHAMSLVERPVLCGYGSRYVWWDDAIKDLEHRWTFAELREAVFATRDLPRGNTDIKVLEGVPGVGKEFVSREVLEVYDLAREHLRGGDERDWTAPEIEARLLRGLFEGEEARGIWEEVGVVPRVFEMEFDAWQRVGL